jgi:nicotinamide phosphoribosyltransferase
MKAYAPYGNPLLTTDSYKASHFLQYPQDTQGLFAYLEARKGARYSHTLFFGLQYILKRYFEHDDCPISADDVKVAEEFWTSHGEPFNTAGWMKVVNDHGGRLPLRIRAPKEGLLIPIDNALITVESTDPELWWLVTYVETMLMRVWYPMTVATRSFFCKEVIRRFLEDTADDPAAEIGFKLHDFGGRGVSSDESAGVGAMSHLVNFLGTDTVEGIVHANLYYPGPYDDDEKDSKFQQLGFSIPAMEHSTIISWGAGGEVEAFRNMLRQHKPRGHKLIACVSDTYDFFNAVENIWCGELLQEVKDSGMTVVVRPDSGDPTDSEPRGSAHLRSQARLRDEGELEGLRGPTGLLPPDPGRWQRRREGRSAWSSAPSPTPASPPRISRSGWAAGLLQKLDRDTMRFAYKVSAVNRGGKWIDTKKAPKTDPSKASKGGRLSLRRLDNVYITSSSPSYHSLPDAMETVFEDGSIKVEEDFATIRARAAEERL